MGVFDELLSVNVNGHTEKKKSGYTELTYLSWPFAWAEVKKRYPNAAYTVWKDANGLPYAYDDNSGYMVYTSVEIDGISHEMWLPVMDGANKAMKANSYQYDTKNGKKTVEAATMFDINKTIMRCLVKNLAMFGLGLYIYAGEDLPDDMDAKTEAKAEKETAKAAAPKQESNTAEVEARVKVLKYCNAHYTAEQIKDVAKNYNKASINELTLTDCRDFEMKLKAAGRDIHN